MPKLDYRNIEKDADRCGGQPVVAGTRIRVATVLACYRQGMGVEEIVQQLEQRDGGRIESTSAGIKS